MTPHSFYIDGPDRRNPHPQGQGSGRRLRLVGRAATALVSIVVWVVATLPGDSQPPTLFGWDKLDHFAAFLALAVLARLGWPRSPRWSLAAFLLAFGVALEIGQATLTTGRVASASDVVADLVGVALGLGFSAVLSVLARRTAPSLAARFDPAA